ncbi:Paf1 complex component, variant 3 [Dermatophagoides farinae]|uniref:Paf1 complex component, variant 3 n=1 Tax=Dermatophagoides farinae TaxID=6954 RepID=A0A922HUF7_DERFA|nr:rna polymerase-associated protein leo1-like protein [Dermatophagoides farinae]KAH9506659.1 Paf1 complex component, variant 3 [Dermatophagoides farinae]
MSDYRNYSSDDGSCDDIGLPKTPGAPLNANHSDSEKDEESNHSNQNDDSDVASNSGQSDDEEVNRSDEPNDDDSNAENYSSDKKSISSRDESEAEQKSSESDSDNDEKSPIDSKRDKVSEDDDDDDGHSNESSGRRKRRSSSSEESDQEEEEQTNKVTKKRKSVIDSSSDGDSGGDDDAKINKPNTEDLFGELSDEDDDQQTDRVSTNKQDEKSNLDDDEDDEGNEQNRYQSEIDTNINEIFGHGDDDERANNSMDEEQDVPIPETRIEVEIPRITANLGDSIHFVKLPNFLSIDTHPYDPQWYEDEIDEDEVHDDEGRARLKLKVENTIRWRNVTDDDCQMQSRESNARVVQWSDGSMSLHLGDEIFDIQTLNLLPGENNHLYIRQGTGLQGQSVFKTKLTFRPFSTESVTHRKLTMSLADRSQKTQKICVLPNVGKDPEAHRSEMIKKEEVKLKASIRKENKTKRVKDRTYTRGLSNPYLDHDDEDDESISIAKIKNQYKRGPNYPNTQFSDEEEESENDDSDLDIFEKKKSAEKRKIVFESDEDDD